MNIGNLTREKNNKESQEEYWRHQRYIFFSQFNKVITCHHLDDVIETWIFTSLHGNPQVIPYQRNNVIRPFLLNRKQELLDWCCKRNVPFLIDESNNDLKYNRNYIRHEIIPKVLRINPGLHKTLKKKVQLNYESIQNNT